MLTVCAGNEASQPECILAEGEGEHMHDSHQIGFPAHHLPCLPTSAMSLWIYPNTPLFVSVYIAQLLFSVPDSAAVATAPVRMMHWAARDQNCVSKCYETLRKVLGHRWNSKGTGGFWWVGSSAPRNPDPFRLPALLVLNAFQFKAGFPLKTE